MDALTLPPETPAYIGDSEEYSADMSAWFFGWLAATFMGEMNVVISELNNLAPSIDAAVAGSNYKGIYDAGRTYQVGHSCSSGGEFFLANTINTGVAPVDGANWSKIGGALGALVGVKLITASGTYNRTVGATKALVFCVQGGQAGGGSSACGASGTVRVGVVSPGATESVTIGAAGSVPNGNGGHSSFGSLMSSNTGGSFGYSMSGTAGVRGGDTPFGFGQGGVGNSGPGTATAGQGYGAGGGSSTSGGQAGAPGCILVVEFK